MAPVRAACAAAVLLVLPPAPALAGDDAGTCEEEETGVGGGGVQLCSDTTTAGGEVCRSVCAEQSQDLARADLVYKAKVFTMLPSGMGKAESALTDRATRWDGGHCCCKPEEQGAERKRCGPRCQVVPSCTLPGGGGAAGGRCPAGSVEDAGAGACPLFNATRAPVWSVPEPAAPFAARTLHGCVCTDPGTCAGQLHNGHPWCRVDDGCVIRTRSQKMETDENRPRVEWVDASKASDWDYCVVDYAARTDAGGRPLPRGSTPLDRFRPDTDDVNARGGVPIVPTHYWHTLERELIARGFGEHWFVRSDGLACKDYGRTCKRPRVARSIEHCAELCSADWPKFSAASPPIAATKDLATWPCPYWGGCKVLRVPYADIDKYLVPGGAPLPPALRGIFFTDGNSAATALMSFAFLRQAPDLTECKIMGVKGGPCIVISGPTSSTHTWSYFVARDNGKGYDNVTISDIDMFTDYTYSGICLMKDGDVERCSFDGELTPNMQVPGQSSFGPGSLLRIGTGVLPSKLMNNTMVREPDKFGDEGGLQFHRYSSGMVKNEYWMRRVVDEHGNRLPNNWRHFVEENEKIGNTHINVLVPDIGPEDPVLYAKWLNWQGQSPRRQDADWFCAGFAYNSATRQCVRLDRAHIHLHPQRATGAEWVFDWPPRAPTVRHGWSNWMLDEEYVAELQQPGASA